MTSDSSLNSLADGIYAKRSLGEITEGDDCIIVYDYSQEESISSLSEIDYMSLWNLYVYVSSPNVADVFAVSERLSEYLNSYRDSNILGISFRSDNQSYDPEVGVYFNDLEFSITYAKN
jgi:hypothetical protein